MVESANICPSCRKGTCKKKLSDESSRATNEKDSRNGACKKTPSEPSRATNENGNTLAKVALIGGASVFGMCALPIAAGFSTGGIVAGSAAAAWQSMIGNVAAGSTFAALQSAAAAGLFVNGAEAAAVVAGLGGGGMLAANGRRKKKKCSICGKMFDDDDDDDDAGDDDAGVSEGDSEK